MAIRKIKKAATRKATAKTATPKNPKVSAAVRPLLAAAKPFGTVRTVRAQGGGPYPELHVVVQPGIKLRFTRPDTDDRFQVLGYFGGKRKPSEVGLKATNWATVNPRKGKFKMKTVSVKNVRIAASKMSKAPKARTTRKTATRKAPKMPKIATGVWALLNAALSASGGKLEPKRPGNGGGGPNEVHVRVAPGIKLRFNRPDTEDRLKVFGYFGGKRKPSQVGLKAANWGRYSPTKGKWRMRKVTPENIRIAASKMSKADREYIESKGRRHPLSKPDERQNDFQPDRTSKAETTTASHAQKEVDVILLHNQLQDALRRRLEKMYGKENVDDESPTVMGTRVDLMVSQSDEDWFYEIKTSPEPRACIREAIGQLLEYSFWPGSQEASRLIVVGKTPADADTKKYCSRLSKRFSLPVEYQHIEV